MKILSILPYAAAATAAVVPQQQLERQVSNLLGLAQPVLGAATEPHATIKLEPKLDPNAIREKVIWGPYKLNPSNGTHEAGGNLVKLDHNSDVFSAIVGGLCNKCLVLSTQGIVTHEDGAIAGLESGVYSHHIMMMDIGRPITRSGIVPMCADGRTSGFNFSDIQVSRSTPQQSQQSQQLHTDEHMHRKRQSQFGPGAVYIAQGGDQTPTIFSPDLQKLKSGFYVGADDEINMTVEIINYDTFAKDIYIGVDYEYIPMEEKPADLYDVGLGAINVSPCGSLALEPPEDEPYMYVGPAWNVTRGGYMLDIKPHLHDGGINVTILQNEEPICNSNAIYGGGDYVINGETWETIERYEPCPGPFPFKAGDKVSMNAWYDLTQHKLRPMADNHDMEAEGMALAIFLYAKLPE